MIVWLYASITRHSATLQRVVSEQFGFHQLVLEWFGSFSSIISFEENLLVIKKMLMNRIWDKRGCNSSYKRRNPPIKLREGDSWNTKPRMIIIKEEDIFLEEAKMLIPEVRRLKLKTGSAEVVGYHGHPLHHLVPLLHICATPSFGPDPAAKELKLFQISLTVSAWLTSMEQCLDQ